jgi:hypothetical protein
MRANAIKPATLGTVSVGETFVCRTVEMFGPEFANTRKLPFEGQMLTVVGFKPRYVNQVEVQDPNGYRCLLPLYMVEKALGLKA